MQPPKKKHQSRVVNLSTKSYLEMIFAAELQKHKIAYEPQYKFDDIRKWRFDFAMVPVKLAIEIEGGIWINGKYNHGSGIMRMVEKMNAAQLQGWRVLQFTTNDIQNGTAIKMTLKALNMVHDGTALETRIKAASEPLP
jgi:very-short-patch-repair endonuclease